MVNNMRTGKIGSLSSQTIIKLQLWYKINKDDDFHNKQLMNQPVADVPFKETRKIHLWGNATKQPG